MVDAFELMLLEETLESPLYCKEIQPVNPKGNQSWIFTGRTDAETPILWPPDAKNWLMGKDPDARKNWRQEEKGMTEDEVVGWYHRLKWHEFEQALGVGDGQGSLACCSPWGHKDSDMTEQLTWPCDYTHTITIAYYNGSKILVPESGVSVSPGNLLEIHNLRHIESNLGMRDRNLSLRNPCRWSWRH